MRDLRTYAVVTGAYWVFTLTDGALRTLVLLHFHRLGYSPVDIAFLFLLYELMGVVTNFIGGWIGSRFGLRPTLYAGQGIQVAALLMLSAVRPDWAVAFSVVYVMVAQALSGVAKDLTKMSAKSAVKLVAGDGGESLLFRWVAVLTGSKNALKGVGFVIGGVLLQAVGFREGLWLMAGAVALALVATLVLVRGDLGRAKAKGLAGHLFAKTPAINRLSAARMFLFASRDAWFVVGVPIFLYETMGWDFAGVSAFLGLWVIGYGIVQAGAPRLLRGGADGRAAWRWAVLLALVPAAIAGGLTTGVPPTPLLLGGLTVFGLVFAVNSSLHSYLIVAYSDADKVAMNVGFYYMANAWGRLGGTLLSGLVYQWAGLAACLWTSAGLVLLAWLFSLGLPGERRVAS